jgi:Protein of unknown function (DUF2809)
MQPRSLKLSTALLIGTVLAGMAVRFAPLGLPLFIKKYGGSMLWALMIYWVITTLLRRIKLTVAVVLAGAIATTVEFFKLYNPPSVDAFRATLPGILLLGRHFSAWDILAYWLAILAGAFMDGHWCRGE